MSQIKLKKHLTKDKRKLERIVHPLVEKEIKNFLSSSKSPIRVVEVPLLFESNLDRHFDDIIVIDVSIDKQDELISNRDKAKALYLKEINKTNKIDENILKATYVIKNDGTKAAFINKINKIITELESLAK